MISLDKLHEYREYNGYYDGFYMQKVKPGRNITTDEEWQFITTLIQDIQLVIQGLASKEFENNVEKKLIDSCDNLEAINEFKKIALQLML